MFTLFCIVLFVQQCYAMPDFYRWAARASSPQFGNLSIGFDYSHHGHYTEGRAGVLIINDNTKSKLASYPLYNGSVVIPAVLSGSCRYLQGASTRRVLDLGRDGWLKDAQSTQLPNQDLLYSYTFPSTDTLYYPLSSGSDVELTYGGTASIVIDSSGKYVKQFNFSTAGITSGNLFQWNFARFSNYPDDIFRSDAMWAPPPWSCMAGKECPGQWPAQVMDVYRAHDNSTWRHVIENSNGADAAGEAYFSCHLSPGPYISHYRIRMSTQWNAYSECTQGNCNFDGPSTSPYQSYGLLLGVGREESLGNNQGDGTGQCDQPGTGAGIGYWYSFNVGGMCPPGVKVGDRFTNCTWEPGFQIVKTITRACASISCNGNWTQAGQDLIANFQKCPAINAIANKQENLFRDQLYNKN